MSVSLAPRLVLPPRGVPFAVQVTGRCNTRPGLLTLTNINDGAMTGVLTMSSSDTLAAFPVSLQDRAAARLHKGRRVVVSVRLTSGRRVPANLSLV